MDPASNNHPPAPRTAGLGARAGMTILVVATLLAAGCGDGGTADTGESTSATPPPAATQTGGDPTASTSVPIAKSIARVRRELRGIPQHGLVLGNPNAPMTIVEYAHFACPACAARHRSIVPTVIERYVRAGKASLEFRGVGGDSPSQSRNLALGASAAATQKQGWDFVQLAYLRSVENAQAGKRRESPARLATALGLDVEAWGDAAGSPARLAEVKAAASVAAIARFSTYPVFLVRARARPEEPFVVLTNPGSVHAFAEAIAKAEKPGG